MRVWNHPTALAAITSNTARDRIKRLASPFYLLIFSLFFLGAASNRKPEREGAQPQGYRAEYRKQERHRNSK